MTAKLDQYRGCLKHLCYDSASAKRRRPYDASDAELVTASDPFLADLCAIQNSGAIRRLQEKTQVYADPFNLHIRDRLTHTLEVASYSQLVADFLGINSSLASAIAMGHDLGHAPFGHFGEEMISELTGTKFRHEILSVIIMQEIEQEGKGLNCTYPVLEGVRFHSRGSGATQTIKGVSEEGNLVMYFDKICYTFSDINDAKRYGIDIETKLPWISQVFGSDQRTRMQTCAMALIKESAEKGRVAFDESEVAQRFSELKAAMYEHVYPSREEWKPVGDLFASVYKALPARYPECNPGLILALLSDKELLSMQRPLMFSAKIPDETKLAVDEIYPFIRGREFDLTDPDIEWGQKK